MILNTYIPSFAIMLMTIVPLYLREDTHFATTITLVLTSILCLFTIMQGSTSSTPNTAYLKLIDVWNMLSLAVTLLNFFTLMLWEVMDHTKTGRNFQSWKTWIRISIPLLTLLAVILYCIIAGTLYFKLF